MERDKQLIHYWALRMKPLLNKQEFKKLIETVEGKWCNPANRVQLLMENTPKQVRNSRIQKLVSDTIQEIIKSRKS